MCHILQMRSGGRNWCRLFVAVALSEALCCPLCSPELSGCCFWKSKIWAGVYQMAKDAFWKSSLSPAHGRCCSTPWCGEAPCGCRRRMSQAAGSFSQVFPACVLQDACASQHRELSGPVRIPDLCPVHWSAAAAPCGSLGNACSVFLMRGRNQEAPPASSRCEAAQNEVQSPKMTCRPLKGSWEDCWALNQYPCSLIYRTGHMHDLIDGVMELNLIYLTTEGSFISY